MATKKQKREACAARNKAYMEELRLSGLEAQRKDREKREHKEKKAWQEQHDKKHSWKNLLDECPLCQERRKKPVDATKIEFSHAAPSKENE